MAKKAPKKTPAKVTRPSAKTKSVTKAGKPAAKAARPAAKAAGKPSPKPGSRPTPTASRGVKPARFAASAAREPLRREPPPAVAPVPTNGRPRKNQAGLSTKELEHFRDLLLQKRRELIGDMGQMEREALRSAGGSNLSNLPLHMADMGTDNYEQEFTLGLVEKDRNMVREINQALAKIMDGTYGICEGTGKPIAKVRLEAQPWARYSIEYARQLEKGFIR